MTMDRAIRIAHISDLHCDSSNTWTANYDALNNALVATRPDIVIATGDMVETPSEEHYQSLINAIGKTMEELAQSAPPFYWITVPGNHDLYNKGNRIFNALGSVWLRFVDLLVRQNNGERSTLFHQHAGKLVYPNDKNVSNICEQIYRDYNIALYPFDSNGKSIDIAFAEGKVNDINKTFNDHNSLYNKIDTKGSPRVEKRIAVLHHHPLPLPTVPKEEKTEPFLSLRNAYKFLHTSNEYSIDLILHGHKHVSWTSVYKAHPDALSAMLVSACGTSAKPEEIEREFRLYLVHNNGVIRKRDYVTSKAFSGFKSPPGNDDSLLGYGEVRKQSNVKIGAPSDIGVRRVSTKTKVVSIRESGNALVVIDMEGISWNPDTEGRDRSIKEKIRADLGRVPYGWKLLCDEENRDTSRLEFWTHPQTDVFDKERPMSVEYLEMETASAARPLSREAESFYRLRHLLFNGYALDEEDFKEMHANGSRVLRQEVCTIQSDYPTELLELVIKFPNEELFPKRSDFHIEPWRKDSLSNETSLAIFNAEYARDDDEFEFLKHKHAIRYRKDLLEVGVVIRHPQPHLAYTLRWNLPACRRYTRLTSEQRAIASKLQQKFINKHDRSVADFYDHLSATIKERAKNKEKEIELLLLGFDKQHSRLKVMHAPERFNNASDLAVGRGVSGTAFRTRSVAYWEEPVDDKEVENQPPEQIIEDYAPGFVVAFPLAYPRINPAMWEKLVEAGNIGRCPVFGVVVVSGVKPDDEFRKINPKNPKGHQEKNERNEIITGFYGLFINSLREFFPDFF